MKISKRFETGILICSLCSAVLFLPASAQQAKLTDPEIASIAVAANQVDINAGEFARTKTKSKDIANFANTMINDHKAVIGQAVALVNKLKVTPKDNDVSKKLMADGKKQKKNFAQNQERSLTKLTLTMKSLTIKLSSLQLRPY